MLENTEKYIDEVLHLPIKDAASRLDMSESRLKLLCRKQGIKRWPARRLQLLYKLEQDLALDYPRQARQFQDEIKMLKEKSKYDPSEKMSNELFYYYKKISKQDTILLH